MPRKSGLHGRVNTFDDCKIIKLFAELIIILKNVNGFHLAISKKISNRLIKQI